MFNEIFIYTNVIAARSISNTTLVVNINAIQNIDDVNIISLKSMDTENIKNTFFSWLKQKVRNNKLIINYLLRCMYKQVKYKLNLKTQNKLLESNLNKLKG